jgi:outer membrane protein assembly factor BamB
MAPSGQLLLERKKAEGGKQEAGGPIAGISFSLQPAMLAAIAVACLVVAGCQRSLDAEVAKPAVAGTVQAADTLKATPLERAQPAPSNSPAERWPVFRGDARAQGVAEGTLADNPEVLWKFQSQGHGFEATVAIADGLVFAGCLDGEFYVLSLDTGEVKWKHHTELGFSAAAAVKDGRVFVGDTDGKFYCFEAATGKPVWGAEAGGEIDSGANFFDNKVLFGSQDATLYCHDAATGKQIWKYTIGDQVRCSPTVVEGRAFLAGCDAKLHIIDLEKGTAISTVEIDAPTGSTPAVGGQRVFFGTEGSSFFAIDWKEAKIAWNMRSPRNMPFRSSAAVTPEAVIFGGRDKQIYSLDPTDGHELWKFATRSRVDSSPVVVGSRVFVGSSDGRLYGLERATGKKVWEYEAGGDFVASPAVAAGRLVIGNTNGTLYCFGTKAP